MGNDEKFWISCVVAVMVTFILVIGMGFIHNYMLKTTMAKNGYELHAIIGFTSPVYQKSK